MDRQSLAEKFKVDKLEDYIIEEFNAGKNEAVILCDSYFEEFIIDIEKNLKNEFKIFKIIAEILKIKKEFSFVNNNFGHVISEAKAYNSQNSNNSGSDYEETEHFAKYFLDYYQFRNLPEWRVDVLLRKIKENSTRFHLIHTILSKSQIYFDYLNDLQKFDDYVWEWNNFEDGLLKIFHKYVIDKIDYVHDAEMNVKLLELNYKNKIDDLESEIKDLQNQVKQSENTFEYFRDYQNKYYYNSQAILNNTYFGDNTPFLFNLYNFLKRNNLLNYGWSYFHTCMEIGNQEMISLNKPKKLKLIGRIFFHLCNYLILHFKDSPMQFIKSKFLIDEAVITDSFKKNHMNPIFDIEEDPELILVDEFFDKQKKIYLKT